MREYDFVDSTLICSQRFAKELAVNGSVSTIKTIVINVGNTNGFLV